MKTPVQGPLFATPPDARLHHLALDRDRSPQQMFARYISLGIDPQGCHSYDGAQTFAIKREACPLDGSWSLR